MGSGSENDKIRKTHVEKMKSDISTPVSGKTTENMHAGSQGARWCHGTRSCLEIFQASMPISDWGTSGGGSPRKRTPGLPQGRFRYEFLRRRRSLMGVDCSNGAAEYQHGTGRSAARVRELSPTLSQFDSNVWEFLPPRSPNGFPRVQSWRNRVTEAASWARGSEPRARRHFQGREAAG